MLIGYARVSKAAGSQSLDLQRDALQAAGVEAALSGPVEEGEAPARERLAASLLGEHAVVGAVEFDEPVAERDQRASCQRPLDEVPPAHRDAMPGGGSFQDVDVAVESEAARRLVRASGDREPVLP